MKKVIAILMAAVMVLGLAACGNKTEPAARDEVSAENMAEGIAESDTAATEMDTAVNGSAGDSGDVMQDADDILAESETDKVEETTDNDENENGAEEQKVLVAYFSATNTTEGVAERIASGLNADLYEITPAEPYTDADLNYNDDNSRTTIEMNDPDARPAISGSVEGMEQYDIVFIGYPIWWADAPRIVSTFVESYDFSGKTVVPFCTSGGSGVGSSATNLERLTEGADWLPGKRLNGSDSQDTVMEWVNSLGLDFGK